MKKNRIYFDNNATTAPSDAVVKAMIELIQEPMNASSIHSFGREARNLVESARKKIRSFLGVPKDFRIIFTCSATEANNMIINSAKESKKKVFVSAVEHPSVLKAKPDKELQVNQNGELILSEIQENGFYSVMLANNETGVIQPIKDILNAVRNVNSSLHVDAVQAIGKIPFNCAEIAADAFTISAHKFGGPYGVGCLIYNPEIFKLNPLMLGGGQEYGIRPGTENVVAIHGMGVAASEIEERVVKMQRDILPIRDFIEDQISTFCNEGIIFGKDATNRLPNTISMTMPGVKSEVQVAFFDSHGIAVSAGSACSAGRVEFPHVQMSMMSSYEEASCTLRVSLGIHNTMDEAKFFIDKWKDLYTKHSRSNSN
jgi:cysteine desulfurase